MRVPKSLHPLLTPISCVKHNWWLKLRLQIIYKDKIQFEKLFISMQMMKFGWWIEVLSRTNNLSASLPLHLLEPVTWCGASVKALWPFPHHKSHTTGSAARIVFNPICHWGQGTPSTLAAHSHRGTGSMGLVGGSKCTIKSLSRPLIMKVSSFWSW